MLEIGARWFLNLPYFGLKLAGWTAKSEEGDRNSIVYTFQMTDLTLVPKANVSGQLHTVGSGYSPRVHTKGNWSRSFWIVRAVSLLLIKVSEEKNGLKK